MPFFPRLAAALFAGGIVLFSYSLYALALSDWKPIAMITPVGGLAFLAGWAALGAHALTGRTPMGRGR